MAKLKFIPPSEPVEVALPPEGDAYEVECKWDGWRAQLHKQGSEVATFIRNGKWMPRFRAMLEPLSRLPAKSAVIDAELVALNAGLPDFRALVSGQSHALVLFCFDLLQLNGKDMQPLPLVKRRSALERLLAKKPIVELQFSPGYDDAQALLARLDKAGLQGVVCKLKAQAYVSGRNRGWLKTKCHAWRKAHADRPALFRKPRKTVT